MGANPLKFLRANIINTNDNTITALSSITLMLLIVVLGTAAACSLTLIIGILYAGLTMILVITDVVRSPDVQFAVERYFPFAVPKIGRLIVSRSSSDFLDFGRRAIATLVVGTWFAVNLTFDCAFVVVDLLGPSRRPEERTPLESVGDGPTPNVPDHGLMPEESNGKPSAAKADTTENTYKYWKKRFTLFSMFDKGVLLDEESFYSVCPEVLSLYMAQKCGKIKVAIDPFCGAGGNVIQLAKIFDKVIAVDIDPEKILLAKQNSTIYGVFHKIEFIVADFFTMSDRIKGDVIVTSPPWGGPDYNRQLIIGPLQLSLNKVLAVAKTVAPKVLLHLPKNIDKFECLKMCNGIGAEVRKIENVFMDRYLNCTLLYVRSNNTLKNTLIRLTSINGFSCKSTFSPLIIRPNGVTNFNAIITHLVNSDICYHTFSPPPFRPFRVITRNLHHTTPITDISEGLGHLGFCVKRVENVQKNGLPLPLFFVDLTPNDNNHTIFRMSSLLKTINKVEKPNKSKIGPPQCHTCQNYGHTKNDCGHEPRCVKCRENHYSEDCTKNKNSPPKCALCQGAHTANFKGCPVLKSLSKRPKVNRTTPAIAPATTVPGSLPKLRTKSKSYAEAGNCVISPADTISSILTNFINNLNSLISPLISLLTKVV
ncbi:hypothetical protein QTP88_021876 [Uroleucon formosanum]